MKKDLHFYLRLFSSTFSVSAFTFGGGYVIVPLMKKKFVDELHWMDETEMLDIVAISQTLPGPMVVDASALVGYRLAGIAGALTALFATVLPPLVIISVITLFYQAFEANRVVAAVLRGMQAGIAAVIADVVAGGAWDVLKSRDAFSIAVMLASFFAVYFGVGVIPVILACGLLGAAVTLVKKRKGEPKA